MNTVIFGDCRETMRTLARDGVRVQCCVTSPPYFGLRSYLPDGVRLRRDLDEATRIAVLRELAALGIAPTSDMP